MLRFETKMHIGMDEEKNAAAGHIQSLSPKLFVFDHFVQKQIFQCQIMQSSNTILLF